MIKYTIAYWLIKGSQLSWKLSWQYAGSYHTIFWPKQEETRPIH